MRVRTDGVELAVETFGDGPPLIFAHGLTGTRHSLRPQFEPLADRYRVVTFDQRGHGDSSVVTDPSLYSPSRMALDIGLVLDALSIEQAVVGGESMGAATALLFAIEHPQRVAALLLTAPAFWDQPNPVRQRLVDMGGAIARIGLPAFLDAAAVRQRDDLGWSDEAIAHIRTTFLSHNADSLATALRTVAGWQFEADVSTLVAPTCILAWPDDALHPYQLAQRLADAIPNAHLQTLPPLPAVFEDPAQIGRAYRQFLNA